MKKTVALLMSVMLICSVFAQVSYADGAFPQDGAQPGAMQKDPDNQAGDSDNKESSDPDKGEAFEKGEAFGSEKRSEAKNEPGKSKDIGDVEETPEEGKLYYPSKRTGYDAKKYDDIPTVDEYYVAEGDGQVWYREGTQGKATFVIKNRGNDENTYSNFSSVAIDGIKPPSSEYDCSEGSLVLNIFSSYLRNLQDGYHEVTIDFKGAYPQTVKTGFQV